VRRCEVCQGPGPCLWADSGPNVYRYACANCHPSPSDPFFTQGPGAQAAQAFDACMKAGGTVGEALIAANEILDAAGLSLMRGDADAEPDPTETEIFEAAAVVTAYIKSRAIRGEPRACAALDLMLDLARDLVQGCEGDKLAVSGVHELLRLAYQAGKGAADGEGAALAKAALQQALQRKNRDSN